jgi:hypothetical protein
MKKYFLAISFAILFCLLFVNENSSASEDFKKNNYMKEMGHSKPAPKLEESEMKQISQKLLDNSAHENFNKKEEIAKNPTEMQRDELKELLNFEKNDFQSASLESPVLLDMDYSTPQVIAAAVVKDSNNVSSTRLGGYTPIYYFYDSRGNLDYVENNTGDMIAFVYYCTGAESYFCPLDWVDTIILNPLGSAAFLEFYYAPYNQSTPTKYYYAELEGEPSLFFYNINMANGASVTNPADQLYFENTYPMILTNTAEISGYTSGIDPYDEDWAILFNAFSDQRITTMGNDDDSKTVTFQESDSKSIYRFFNKIKGNHFYTKSKPEKNNIVSTLSNEWNYEGVAYKAYNAPASNITALYRFWNKKTGFHFYTQNESEKNNIIATLSDTWNYENVAYYTYSSEQPGTTAVYRFFNKIQGNHFYTTSITERNDIINNLSHTWNYENVAWYVPVD